MPTWSVERAQSDRGGDEGVVGRGEGDRLTGRGGGVGLEARGAAGDSASRQAGGGQARGAEDEPHGVSGGSRPEELDHTSGADGSRALAVTSDGDGTGKSGRDTG
ncbi:hypothetical protein PO909_010550 [Leuciscus waleckii]